MPKNFKLLQDLLDSINTTECLMFQLMAAIVILLCWGCILNLRSQVDWRTWCPAINSIPLLKFEDGPSAGEHLNQTLFSSKTLILLSLSGYKLCSRSVTHNLPKFSLLSTINLSLSQDNKWIKFVSFTFQGIVCGSLHFEIFTTNFLQLFAWLWV
mgnify:CR=1 FL=1